MNILDFNLVPGVQPVDTAATALTTQFIDCKTAHQVAFIISAGLASLNIVTKMFRGEKADLEDGWGTYKEIDRERERGLQKKVKLLNPSSNIDKVLDTVGFKQFFEVYTDLKEAVQSF